MLTRIGKVAMAIVLSGGMVLLADNSAFAGGSTDCGGVPSHQVPCDGGVESDACGETAALWYYDGGYWCPEYVGGVRDVVQQRRDQLRVVDQSLLQR